MQPENALQFWIDVNLPASIAPWLNKEFGVIAKSFNELGFSTEDDNIIMKLAAKSITTVVITTKDYDFVEMSNESSRTVPRVLYLNIGNVTNVQLRQILKKHFGHALEILSHTTQKIIEITN